MESMGIGKIARRAGVSIDTVRYYEKSGLLAPAARLQSGYRRYGELQLSRLRFIRRAQDLGFSLKDIQGCSACRASGMSRASNARPNQGRGHRSAHRGPHGGT